MVDNRTFVKVHDGFPDHPKVLEVGGDAAWLFICGLCYCARHLTDGNIPKSVVGRLSDRRQPSRLAERLVAAGMWIDQGDHYEVHDYLEHQRSAADVIDLAEKRREAGSKGGRVRANRQANAKAKPKQVLKQTASKTQAEVEVEEDKTPPPSVGPPKRATKPLPADWQPNPTHRSIAAEEHVDCDREATRFRDWAAAKGERKADWDAAFRNWLRRDDLPRAAANGTTRPGSLGPDQFPDRDNAAAWGRR